MSLRGVLSELEGLSLDDDISEDAMSVFLRTFSEKYSIRADSTRDVFRFVDSLLSGKRTGQSSIGAHPAFESIESLLESQMEETRVLATQRNQLVEQLRKLDEVCRESDSMCQNLSVELTQTLQKLKEKPAQQPTPKVVKATPKREEERREDDAYLLLASVHRALSVAGGDIQMDIDRIKEDTSKTAGERLVEMTKVTSNEIIRARKQVELANERNEELKDLCQERGKQCSEVLSVLEEEVDFVQKLAFNRDLQSVVMYRQLGTSCELDAEQREELARRCAAIGSFVDEKVTRLNSDDICGKLESCGVKKPTGIFDLMKPANSESRIRRILEDAEDSNDVNVRKLTDILIAQTLMNEILKNHSAELSGRVTDVARCNQKVEKMRIEKDELAKETATKSSEVIHLKKKLSTMKRKLSKIVQVTKGEDPVVYIQALKKELKGTRRLAAESKRDLSVQAVQPYSVHISTSSEDTSECDETMSISLHRRKVQEITDQLSRSKAEYEKILFENTQIKQSLDVANTRATVLERRNRNLEDELSRLEQGSHRVQDLQDRLQAMSREMNNTTLKLREDLRLCEQHNAALADEKASLISKIEQMEEIYSKGIADIKSKSSELRTEMGKKVQNIDRLTAANQTLTKALADKTDEAAKLQAELDSLTITNKSLTLKLKAAAEKGELEKQSLLTQIAATKTSAQSQLDKYEKEMTQQVASHDEKIIEQITSIVGHVRDTDIHGALADLASEVADLRKVQSIYTSLIEDVAEVQTMLHLRPNESIAESIRTMLQETDKLKASTERYKDEAEQKQSDVTATKKELSRLQSSASAAKQWEAWSRRILRVVRNSRSADLTGDQLRLALEESLLSSVSNRRTFSRLETLRSEKKLFTKFNRRVFTTKSEERPQWGSVLVAVIALQRINRGIGGTAAAICDL